MSGRKANSRLEAGLAYEKLGWSVIPVAWIDEKKNCGCGNAGCPSPGKHPLVGWKPHQEIAAGSALIEDWWSEWPRANVGIVTGSVSKLIVVDIDPDRGADPRRLRRDLEPMATVKTGSGGYHFYFSGPADGSFVANRVGSDGIDVRGEGGFVVAPPSRHKSGATYKWLRGSRRSELSPFSGDLLDGTEDTPVLSGEHWVSAAIRGVDKGERNNTCAKLAGYFLNKGLPKDVVVGWLRIWDGQNRPPLGTTDIERTVESVSRTRARRQPDLSVELVKSPDKGIFELKGLDELLTDYADATIPWIIPDWLPAETVAMIVAPPGGYKTWIAQDLAVSVATGTPFLGQVEVCETGPVIFIQQEDWLGQLAQRFRTIITSRFELPEPRMLEDGSFEIFLLPTPDISMYVDRQFRFGDERMMAALEQAIEGIGPKLVILDPLYSATDVNDYMASSAQHMLGLKVLRDRYGCSFVIAHHTKKRAERSDGGADREDVWGSQFLNAVLETGWQIRPGSTTNSIYVRRHFKVAPPIPLIALTFDIGTDTPSHYSVKVGTPQAASDRDEYVERRLLEVLRDEPGISMNGLVKSVRRARGSVKSVVDRLVESGEVLRSPGKFGGFALHVRDRIKDDEDA